MADSSYRRVYRQPQVSLVRRTSVRMRLVSAAAFLAIIQSALSDSFASLEVAAGALAGALITEYAANRLLKTGFTLKDGSAAASALILTLLLPNHVSPVLAALGGAFAMGIVKHSFGGLGANWLNPALGGWLFVRASWPDAFSPARMSMAAGDRLPLFLEHFGRLVRAFLNRSFFPLFGAELPGDFPPVFFSSGAGIIADRGILALLLGTILLAAFEVSRSWIPALFLVIYVLLIRMAGDLSLGFWNGDILSALSSGGTLVAAFILLVDPATGAKSSAGAAAGTALAAFFSFVFRYAGGETLGAVFAVVLMNILFPLIRILENRWFYLGAGERDGEAAEAGRIS
ncbi:MAG: RnfABCDGE type electron transport complex subunit D [Spirochaetaceae bacterium]|nr:RnfABCDGE type electron transport complex subunit D [Spirochaetaceae bacterium]